jgi:hypothetical protein
MSRAASSTSLFASIAIGPCHLRASVPLSLVWC